MVARRIHGKLAAWVSEYSHENLAWQKAFRAGVGSKIDLMMALQQVVDEDEWIDGDDPEVAAALRTAADGEGVPF